MATTIQAVIFDLGGVLIDWNPDYLYRKLIPNEAERRKFLAEVCTPDWNEEQDGGRPLQEATEWLVARHPDAQDLIEAYYGRWEEMLNGPIQGTVDIFRKLKESGRYQLYALTNWSGELFPIALEKFDFLHWFDGRVVSGDEKLRKPQPEFYQLILDRYALQPATTLFIDDNLRNVLAAEAMGIQCILFQDPEGLREALKQRAVL